MEINVSIDKGLERHCEVSWVQNIAEQVLVAQGIDPRVELGLLITTQEKIQQLNQKYLGRDEPTDVLAFSMLTEPLTTGESEASFVQAPDGVIHLGEVIISKPQAAIQAKENQHPVKKEIAILIIHGVLHLLGYEYDKPEFRLRMLARGEEILGFIDGVVS